MALRFCFDECADEDVALAVAAAGVDVVTVTGHDALNVLARQRGPGNDRVVS
jgi:hypothetical protein